MSTEKSLKPPKWWLNGELPVTMVSYPKTSTLNKGKDIKSDWNHPPAKPPKKSTGHQATAIFLELFPRNGTGIGDDTTTDGNPEGFAIRFGELICRNNNNAQRVSMVAPCFSGRFFVEFKKKDVSCGIPLFACICLVWRDGKGIVVFVSGLEWCYVKWFPCTLPLSGMA